MTETVIEHLRPQQQEIVKRALDGKEIADGWVRFYRSRGDGVQLDGDFTIEELEEIVRVMKLIWPPL